MEFKTTEELLAFARRLEGSTVNETNEKFGYSQFEGYSGAVPEFHIEYKGKGGFGEYLEERYFGKRNDNESRPDFANLGIELKVSPLKKLQSGDLAVKERLVLNKFRFVDIAEETFDTSRFLEKNAHILLVFYLYQKENVAFGDYKISLVDIWNVIERDIDQIKADWNFIVDKIKRGEAHLLSEGDTVLLGACTKGATKADSMQAQPYSDVKAPGRALCFKLGYIKSIYKTLLKEKSERDKEKYLQSSGEWKPLDTMLHERLDRFYGLSGRQIAAMLGKNFNAKNKSIYADLSRYMMGLKRTGDTYHELEAGNIQIKSIRIEYNGSVKESMSFRNIYYKDIINEEWDESLFYEELTSKFILMFFRKFHKEDSDYSFDGFLIWNMPLEDIAKAESVWKDTKEKIKRGDYSHFLKQQETTVAHVRPKASKQSPVMETPEGTFEKKKSFWLNNDYIQEIADNRSIYKPI